MLFISQTAALLVVLHAEIAQGVGAKGAAAEAPSAAQQEDWRIDAVHGNGAENHLTSGPQVLFV